MINYMKIGICVEGQNDIEAIKTLLSKINSTYDSLSEVNYEPRYHRGYPDLIGHLHQTLFEFNQLNIELIVVLIDNDREKKNKRLKRLIEKCRKSKCNYDFIAPGVAVEALEAWLLADESALSKVAKKTIPCQPSPENIQKPDEVLKQITQSSSIGIPYHEVLRGIASELDLNIVLRRCKSFKNFHSFYSLRLKRFKS